MKFKVAIKLFVSYPGKIFRWITDGRFHNFTILISVVTTLYFLKVIIFQAKIISATFLVIGLSIIIWQMIGDSKRFSEQSPKTFKHWLKKFPSFKPKALNINVGTASVVCEGLKPRVRISIPENSSLEDKVNFLMRRREELENDLDNIDDKLDLKVSELKIEIKEIENRVEETTKVINSTISDVTIGNYDLRLFSIVLMICGTFLQILI